VLLLRIYIYIYIYIPLPIYNPDDVVMSRENRNFYLHLFVKGGALQRVYHMKYTNIYVHVKQ
jgi:hypothetical protein